MNTDQKKNAAMYFIGNPTAIAFLFTSDGLAFHEKNKHHAEDHAAKLKDQNITRVTREEFKEWGLDGSGEEEELGYKDMTVAELKAELEQREIEIPAKPKKAELIALLEADDEEGEEGDDDEDEDDEE